MDLNNYYNSLKEELNRQSNNNQSELMRVSNGSGELNSSPESIRWRKIASNECDKLKDKCRKHIILDIYCNILPLDKEFIDGNMGLMKKDIDQMLDSKGLSATQYLTSAAKETKAPLIEYVLRMTDLIGKSFMEKSEETLKDAQKNNIDIPAPEAPDVEDEEIDSQLVDIKNDAEYKTFIEKLKEKTVNKIVADISKIINNKKEENEMQFDPKPEVATESAFSISLDYLQKGLINENAVVPAEMNDELIGIAIRESTMLQIDSLFKQPYSDIKDFASRIKFGKGILINESATRYFVENAQRYESLYKEVDGNKYDVSNFEKVDKDGKKTPMTDDEAKKVLDPDGYKNYKNRSNQ